MMKDLFLTGF